MVRMNHVTRLIHAYKQAPWRTQRQWIGIFLLGLLLITMVAALYLDVTARAAILGREIQYLETEINLNVRTNADLQTQLAVWLSASEMEQRSKTLGFRPIEPDELEFIIVPGYVPPQPPILAAVPQPKMSAPSIPPEYTQSLLDWIEDRLQAPILSRPGASG